jgi:hypothetical protein
VDSNTLWADVETQFIQAKTNSSQTVDSVTNELFYQCNSTIKNFIESNDKKQLTIFLPQYFSLAANVAAHPNTIDSFLQLYAHVKSTIKQQSVGWQLNDLSTRQLLYKTMYGMRAATEEVLLQNPQLPFNNALFITPELSSTPSTEILGIKVHSCDLLVSRGGAAVSALISRGNDYPGNFSHVAQLLVDKDGKAYLIEAHIEKGVAISTVEQYLNDKKLRLIVLRPRFNLPQLTKDPMLPHKAASFIKQLATKKYIPYDFAMNYHDSTAMFCSEVGSYAYQQYGLQLWQTPSTISSAGIVNWLHTFGVQNFVTQMPSDLEYDTQLSVVAEWRDVSTLQKDHIDNAVIDVLLEQADKGKEIGYNLFMLPIARCIKGWCMLKNMFGGLGMIPEGMSATQALKNQTFEQMHATLKIKLTALVQDFVAKNKYYPPYWKIISLCSSINY